MIFPDGVQPTEIVHGIVQVLGARRVQVLIDGKRLVIAKCDKDLLIKLAVGSAVIVAFLGNDQTLGYVLSTPADPFGTNSQGIFTI